jgi:PPOX class probable F420-dependent enzyme
MMMTVEEARRMLQTDKLTQELLGSPIVARLAYTWRDGSPRVVPMWFHWTGEDILMGAPPNSPKMKVLAARPQVAVSIDTVEWPYKWLTFRGTASVQVTSQPFTEYQAMARRYLGDAGGEQFLTALRQTFQRWARIAIRPTEVRILDFQGRFPSAWSAKAHG